MSLSTSTLSYADCLTLFDAALNDPRGVRLSFPSRGKAEHLIARLHQCRTLKRKDNREVYPRGAPLHGKSEWDVLRCSLRGNGQGWWVYIEHVSLSVDGFEKLSEVKEELLLDPAPVMKLLTAPTSPVVPVGLKRRV